MGGVRRQGDPEQATLVFNATPIIYLCKAGLAGRLGELRYSFEFLTTTEVYEEVYVKGIEKGVGELSALKEFFDGGVMKVVAVRRGSRKAKGLSRLAGLHPGEESVVSLALVRDATAIIDDKRARQVALALGVKISGTPGLIVELVMQRIVSRDEAKRALEKMVEEGWYCSAKLFSKMMKTIDEL